MAQVTNSYLQLCCKEENQAPSESSRHIPPPPPPSQPTLKLGKTTEMTCSFWGDCTRHTPSDNGLTGTLSACQSGGLSAEGPLAGAQVQGIDRGASQEQGKPAGQSWPRGAGSHTRTERGQAAARGEDTPHSTPSSTWLQALTLCTLTVTLCNETYESHFTAGETEAE